MSKRISRRSFLTHSALAGSALAAPFVITRPGWSQTGPIKFGMVEARSGPNKYVGDARIDTATFVVERVNAAGGLLGRKVEMLVVDSEFKPDVASRRAGELLIGEKIDLITAFGGAVAKVVAQAAFQQNKLFVSTSTLPSEMTGVEFLPTTFSCAFNSEMLSRSAAAYIAKAILSKVYILCQDYASGRSAGETFKMRFNSIKRADQAIVGEEYHPTFRLTDFAPYITKVMASGADAVMTANFGPDLRLLLQQGHQLGWKIKAVGFYLNDPTLTSAIGDAAIGHVTTGINMITLDTQQNKELTKPWQARFPNATLFSKVPDLAVGQALSGFMWMLDVVTKAGSLDTETLIKTWEGDKFQALWGGAEMRACDHQVQSGCGVAEIVAPKDIPIDMRFYGDAFPYIGPATVIPREMVSVPLAETRNKRCTAQGR